MMQVDQIRTVPAVALATVVWCCLIAFSAAALAGVDFESPLAGPGVENVKKSQLKKIRKSWQDLINGDLKESRKRVARFGTLAPTQLLEYQIRLSEGDEDVMDDLIGFCEQRPDYASAWITLSVAAERGGSELVALRAARRAGELWPDSPWTDRGAELEKRWITDRIRKAGRLYDGGDFDAAIAELDAAEALGVRGRDSVLLRARILVAGDDLDGATTLLDELPDEPDARYLQGQIAESGRNWQVAMDSYSSLPDAYPNRGIALHRAQIQWRLTLLPEYARAGMATDEVTRSDLAVVLVSIQPQLETLPGGEVPVMSDIVDQPGQREIITAVRLGIMNADTRGHRFFPDSNASLETIQNAIQRSRELLGLPKPLWCDNPDMIGSTCIPISSPASGGSIVNAVLDVASGADQ